MDGILECFVNDYYSYTLRPAMGLLSGICAAISELEATEVVIVTARSTGRGLPMYGFQTTESKRGSAHLLGARVAEVLPEVFPRVQFKFHYVRGDLLCSEPLRRLVLSAANLVFSGAFILRCLWPGGYRLGGEPSAFRGVLALVRTEHQARFARALMEGRDGVRALVLPQITQGSIRTDLRLRRSITEVVPLYPVVFRVMPRVARGLIRDLQGLRSISQRREFITVAISSASVKIGVHDIASELRLASATLLYRQLLSQILDSVRPERLVNFELVGRMAGLEASAARSRAVETMSIQTATISAVPHPVFPHSDWFFTDSMTTCQLIAGNGSLARGRVVYHGPPYRINAIKAPRQVRTLAYFTQPYEAPTSTEILRALGVWARRSGAVVRVRLHPRDTICSYRAVLDDFGDVMQIASEASVSDSIGESDVCVTRTSSVAKEAIALGRPVLLCLWTAMDHGMVADYIAPDLVSQYCASSDLEVWDRLSRPEDLAAAAECLQLRMYQGKESHDLAASVFRQ